LPDGTSQASSCCACHECETVRHIVQHRIGQDLNDFGFAESRSALEHNGI
jgi:hypothetical protein